MTFPNFPDKHDHAAFVRAAGFHAYLREIGNYPTFRVPDAVILCYQASLLDHIREHHTCTAGDGYLAKMLLPDEAGGHVGIFGGFGIGAPVAAIRLEELIEFGVKRVISIGTAGSLQRDLGIGDLVVCDRAIRDEGTSHHYLPPERYAQASAPLTRLLQTALDAAGSVYRVGTTWTTDAPYRETVAEVESYQAEGVATVEMEAAALFAVATRRRVDVAAAFSISDSLADCEWTPRFGSSEASAGLEVLFRAALDALAEPREVEGSS